MKDIIGHEGIRGNLLKTLENGDLAHAHLIVGEDGIGKSKIVHELAVNILGKSGYSDREYADIKEYRVLNNKKSISVDQIRSVIEEVNKKPYEGDKKVIIFHDADKMTVQAQNAFLKTIEEPPQGVYIFLLSEAQDNILDTIRSRCQIHKLKKLSAAEIQSFLLKNYPAISEEEKKAATAYCDGIPGKAVKFIEDSSLKEIREGVLSIIIEINKKNLQRLLEYEEVLLKYNDMWQEVLKCFVSFICDIMIYKETGTDKFLINIDKIKIIKNLASDFSYRKLNGIINIIGNTERNLENNVNAVMVYHVMLLKMQD